VGAGPAGRGAAGTAGAAGAPAAAAAAAPAAAAAAPAPDVSDAVETSAGLIGERGGPMLAVGLSGLGALALAAELDRRKIRRALREIPLEV
jgi:hypothetical protein